MKVVYVAGKFTGANAWEVTCNTHAACCVGADIYKAGASPLIPHANAQRFDGTVTQAFWCDATLELMLRCDGVLCAPNWRLSQGAQQEVEAALKAGIPVAEVVWQISKETTVRTVPDSQVMRTADWVDSLPRLRRIAGRNGPEGM